MIGLISKQDTINAVSEYALTHTDLDADKLNGLVKVIMKLPEPPIRRGHWVYGEDEDGVDGYRCNKCGFFVTWDYKHSHIHFIDDYLFCPHCNARMDEVT